MNKYIPDMETHKLTQRLQQYPDIISAYLFGSGGKRRLTAISDIDLAVLLEEPVSFEHANQMVFDLLSDIQELYGRESDIVILNRLDNLPFFYEIVSTGELIFVRDRDAHKDFIYRKLLEYLDYQPVYERLLETYARKLRHG